MLKDRYREEINLDEMARFQLNSSKDLDASLRSKVCHKICAIIF